MLEWHDFVEQLLSEESSFDGISLSFDGNAHSVGVPPIIKASVLMLDRMITHQGKFNILVFPERIQSIFIFTLIKLLHNIAEGKIERAYDPEAFKPGEKLKLGNAVVEFVGIEDEKNERRMKINVADLTISAHYFVWPKNNAEFWKKKIGSNIERDAKNHALLAKLGWNVIVVWECELKRSTAEETLNILVHCIVQRQSYGNSN